MIKKVFPILALCVFSATLGIGIISPLLPLYISSMGATGVGLGIIMASYHISNSVAVPIVGRQSDRRGRKVFLATGLLIYSITSVGYIFADNVVLLSVVRLFQGVAGAMVLPIAIAYLGDLSPEGEEGKWMGYANAAFFSGFGFGPFIGGVVTENFGQNPAFFILIGLNLIAFFIAFFFLPEVSRRKTSEEEGPTLSFKEMTGNSMVKGLFSFRMAQALGRGGIGTFLPIYAAMIGISTSLIGMLLTVNILSVTLLSPVGGMIADRFNRRTITIISSILFAAILAVIPYANGFVPLLLILLVQGLTAAVSMPAATALVVEEGRTYGMGSTMSVFFVAMGIGIATGPIISGGIHDSMGIDWVFYFGAVMGAVGSVLFAWFTRGYQQAVPERVDKPRFLW
jgi:DHA1 family multidrug resistance protein-like MFS transporter